MRPIKLTMSAFGPYAGKAEVNFELLGDHGLYLIAGDTGSGKTTIFDAISFALYGKASGENRDISMLRSKYARPETPTEVELLFDYAGQRYNVRRNPEYERPRLRGGGMTTEKAAATLTLPGGKKLSRLTEVDESLRRIMGIDKKQFSQIAMIAQGDFLKSLLARTDERQEIFRKIFQTEKFASFQDSLKKSCGEIKIRNEESRKNMRKSLENIHCPESHSFFPVLQNSLSQGYPDLQALTEALAAFIRDDQERLNVIALQKGKLEENRAALLKKITLADAWLADRNKLNLEAGNLENLEKEYGMASESFAASQKRETEKDALAARAAAIEASFADYDELGKCAQKSARAREQIKNFEILKKEKEKNILKTEDELKTMQAERQSLEKAGETLKDLENSLEKAGLKQDALRKLYRACQDMENLGRKTLEAQRKVEAEGHKAINASSRHEKLYRAHLAAQAGLLARTELSEGRPCPVCGSLEHPAPASLPAEAPTPEALEAAKLAKERAERTLNEANVALAAAKSAMEAKKSAVQEQARAELGENHGADIRAETESRGMELSASIRDANFKIEAERRRLKRRRDLDELLPEKGLLLEKLKKELEGLKEELGKRQAEKESAEAVMTNLSEKLKFPDKKSALAELDRLEREAKAISGAIQAARKKLEDCAREKSRCEGRIRQLKDALEKNPEPDRAALAVEMEKLEARKGSLEEESLAISKRLGLNEEALRTLREEHAESIKRERKMIWLKALSDTASGSLAGRDKISLETYAQMTCFERIIRRANIRFLVMTGGQYELKRCGDALNRTSRSGLDLNVIDHCNGTERSVRTLSGGESFLASLALALGLSDEIQASAGGVRLESMFVDEGFGSLDEEALRKAMKALSDLASSSRLVGVISHVGELKEKIDRQILVRKEGAGSLIEYGPGIKYRS